MMQRVMATVVVMVEVGGGRLGGMQPMVIGGAAQRGPIGWMKSAHWRGVGSILRRR
jgi:hypothetical protein